MHQHIETCLRLPDLLPTGSFDSGCQPGDFSAHGRDGAQHWGGGEQGCQCHTIVVRSSYSVLYVYGTVRHVLLCMVC